MTESVSVTLLAHPDLSQVLVLLKVKPPIEIKCDITCAHLDLSQVLVLLKVRLPIEIKCDITCAHLDIRQGRWYLCFNCYSSIT